MTSSRTAVSARQQPAAANARLRISSELLDPLDVTLALRLPPDHTHRRGEPQLRRAPDGSVREYPAYTRGLWSMSSQPWVSSAELDAHLRWLLEQLEPRRAALQRLQESGIWTELVCYLTEPEEQSTPLPAQTLGRCVALALPVVREAYVDLEELPARDEP
jgi:hypothetical protein